MTAVGDRERWSRAVVFASAVALAILLATACGGEVDPDSCGSGGSGAKPAKGAAGAAANCGLSCELALGCHCRTATPECESDSDCTLATNVATCCGGCEEGYPKSLLEREPCIVPRGSPAPAFCAVPRCTDGCPIDCTVFARAICRDGRCEGTWSCPPDQVQATKYATFETQCVSKCTSDLDCLVARETGVCCPLCSNVYPISLVESSGCMIPEGSTALRACEPPRCSCLNVDCGSPIECLPQFPKCLPEGRCESL